MHDSYRAVPRPRHVLKWTLPALLLTALGTLQASPSAAQELPVSTLEEVLISTLQRNEALKISAESVNQAQLRKKRFLMSVTPDVSFQAYNRKVGGTGTAGGGSSGGGEGGAEGGVLFFPEGTYYGYNFSLTQPLYTGGRALAAYRGAGEVEGSLRIGEELTRRDLLVAAAEAYYAVLAAREAVRIGEQAVVSSERHLELARKRLDLGEGLVTDRLRAEVNLAEVTSDLIRFRNGLADSRDRVRRISGRDLTANPEMIEFLSEITGSLGELVQEALSARLEREQDRHGIRAAEEDVREKKGRFLPALFVAAGYSGVGEEVSDQATGWDAGLYLKFPIYERASRFYLLKESRSVLRQAELADDARVKDITLEVSRLYNALKASESQITTLRKQVEFAGENLRLAEKRFAVGLADSIELVDTQTADLTSRVNLTAEILRFEIAKLRLTNALGRELFPEVRGEGEGWEKLSMKATDGAGGRTTGSD
jgi:outer membrane protein TolC